MNSIKEIAIENKKILNDIREFVENDTSNLNTSLLYSTKIKDKIIDTNIRKSKFKLLKNPKIFEFFDDLLEIVNQKDSYFNYRLVRNDITYIEYEKGDFFDKHEDFLSIKSNLIEEYTMIYCLDANCNGGETIFHVNEFFRYPPSSTITPENIILFRKDLCHEGSIIKEGYKKILTANIWCLPKNCDKIVVFSFKNTNKKRIIKYDNIISFGDSMLKNLLPIDDLHDTKIKEIDELNCSYEEFEIIEKIYNRCYININNFIDIKKLIDYCEIDYKNIFFSKDDSIETPKKIHDSPFTQNIILCKNEEEQLYYTNISKKLNFSYIPFMILYAEGSFTYDSNGDPTDFDDIIGVHNEKDPENTTNIKMKPLLCYFGENKSLLFMSKIQDYDYDYNNNDYKEGFNYNIDAFDKLKKK